MTDLHPHARVVWPTSTGTRLGYLLEEWPNDTWLIQPDDGGPVRVRDRVLVVVGEPDDHPVDDRSETVMSKPATDPLCAPDLHDHTTWMPLGTPAVPVWLCGQCMAELTNDDPRECEVCGCRYDVESGAFLGDDDGY